MPSQSYYSEPSLVKHVLERIATLDAGYRLLLGSVAVFTCVFHALAPLYPITKQRAWILTALGSAAFTMFSLPLAASFVIHRGDVSELVRLPAWSNAACRVFQAYLISDLLMGSIYYRKHISIATGWAHHIIYMILVDLLVRWRWSHIFALAGIMELPTFLLSLGTMRPTLRHDILFASTFFATRIVFHVFLFASYIPHATRVKAVEGSFLPSILFAAAFPMHVMWFTGCIKGFIRRAEARKAAAAELGRVVSALPLLTPSSEEKPVEILIHSTMPSTSRSPPDTRLLYGSIEAPISYPTTAQVHLKPVKPYPPSTHTLPSTPTAHSPPRIITLSPTVRSRSRSASLSSQLHSPSPSPSPSVLYSPVTFPVRPAMQPRRRSSRSDEVMKMIAELAAASPTMQSAVAVGRGVVQTVGAYRGRVSDGVRRRAQAWRGIGRGTAVQAY